MTKKVVAIEISDSDYFIIEFPQKLSDGKDWIVYSEFTVNNESGVIFEAIIKDQSKQQEEIDEVIANISKELRAYQNTKQAYLIEWRNAVKRKLRVLEGKKLWINKDATKYKENSTAVKKYMSDIESLKTDLIKLSRNRP